MRAGRIEQANAIALQIGKEICRNNAAKLTKINKSTNSTQMWKEVTRYTKQSHDLADSSKFNAEILNDHYAGISTDHNYTRPIAKIVDSLHCKNKNDISEEHVFKYLDKLEITATGLDKLPSWFLRVGAPFFANPLSKLFNMSLHEHVDCSEPMESGSHSSACKSQNSRVMFWLSTNLYNTCSIPSYGENSRSGFYLSSHPLSIAETIFCRPICIQAEWIYNSGFDILAGENYQFAWNEHARLRLRIRFQQGVWHRET